MISYLYYYNYNSIGGEIKMNKIPLKWSNLGHLLEESAERYKDKPLFIFEDKSISFIETNERVNRLANALKALGVRKGNKISVMLPNGFEFPISWLAIAKLGAVMVPSNVFYKEKDLQYLLGNSEASFIIIQQDYLSTLESIRHQLPHLNEVIVLGSERSGYHNFETLLKKSSSEFNMESIHEEDLLNLQYTSGTTGFPKGCMLTHRYWLLFGEIANQYIQVKSNDINLTSQPFYYMDPQWNTVLCLAMGIPLVIMKRFSPSNFWSTVHKHRVTFLYMLGTMPFYLLKQDENPDLEKNHHLRFIMCSGILPEFHQVFEERWNVPWREVFGMTETGFDLIVELDDKESIGTGAMGKAITTKQAKVINNQNEEVPEGKVGELVVRGEPMMLGYWKNEEETKRVFRNGWFHTGDLVYKDAKDYFHIVGRIKDMVRRSGENISSMEVEGALLEMDVIQAVAVVPVPDELRGEEVKAYIVLKENQQIDPEEIISFAKSKLARFKVPRYIEFVNDLPKTPSERVEKHKLMKEKKDLCIGSYDAQDKIWRKS